jgi:hypothetical protein
MPITLPVMTGFQRPSKMGSSGSQVPRRPPPTIFQRLGVFGRHDFVLKSLNIHFLYILRSFILRWLTCSSNHQRLSALSATAEQSTTLSRAEQHNITVQIFFQSNFYPSSVEVYYSPLSWSTSPFRTCCTIC